MKGDRLRLFWPLAVALLGVVAASAYALEPTATPTPAAGTIPKVSPQDLAVIVGTFVGCLLLGIAQLMKLLKPMQKEVLGPRDEDPGLRQLVQSMASSMDHLSRNFSTLSTQLLAVDGKFWELYREQQREIGTLRERLASLETIVQKRSTDPPRV